MWVARCTSRAGETSTTRQRQREREIKVKQSKEMSLVSRAMWSGEKEDEDGERQRERGKEHVIKYLHTYLDNRRKRVQPKIKAPKASMEVAKVTQGSQWLGEKIALPAGEKEQSS